MDHNTQFLLAAILASACKGRTDDSAVALTQGTHLVGVTAQADGGNPGRMGLASRLPASQTPGGADQAGASELHVLPTSLKELASLLLYGDLDTSEPSFGLAAVNALLPPPPEALNAKAQDILAEHGAGKRLAMVGHFPFVDSMDESVFAEVNVLEFNPKPGDLPASKAEDVLPRAEVAFISGTTITNRTLPSILRMLPRQCFTMLVGPSTPFAPELFAMGVDALAGAVVTDPNAAAEGIVAGHMFRRLSGVEGRILLK